MTRAEASLTIELCGDLDMPATFRLEPAVDRLLEDHDIERLILDLSEVSFMDSTGLGALLSIRERTRVLEIEMTIAGVSDPVRRLLELTGTAALLQSR